VVHVHLKDVDATLASEVRAGRRSLLDATRAGLFKALGQGDARIAEIIEALQAHGYAGWLVLEQDTAITGDEPTMAGGPMRDAGRSIAFLHQTAELEELSHELQRASDPEMKEVAKELAAEAKAPA
jgi:inosose dehydratase